MYEPFESEEDMLDAINAYQQKTPTDQRIAKRTLDHEKERNIRKREQAEREIAEYHERGEYGGY